ncbi:beta-glucosidase [Sediminihabitans luteus]|uniref:Beta-glucosidase n=1 Tax=Sediminihabitans luteus TaxID=1138585 RepID=A0A2M9CDJ2_9CELL|nr:GH1 family beta-glucosidase [Sediminihabitans luteus]PJJ69957.1 beta-glucosidase [Sediminihabitans luteus]GII99277.1 beta-glucosidase [Sediminihabitans luteus]
MSPYVPTTPLGPGPNATGAVRFPEGFLWGSATAAFQVEGASHVDGREDSIWDAYCRVPGTVVGGDDGTQACEQYTRYVDDVRLMADLNLATYRFSTSWSRVRPGGGAVNPQGVDYYSRLVDELLAQGVMPWLTLYHWDLPQALEDKGGWANRDTAYLFQEYAVTMHEALGDRVGVWTTLNEPWCSAFLGYTGGQHAPGRRSPADGLAAAHHLMLGHGLAVQALRERAPEANLGITLNFEVEDPKDPSNPADVDAARRLDGQFTRIFADPIFRGAYPLDVLEDVAGLGLEEVVQDGDLEIISTPIDSLGVNYYHGNLVAATPPEHPLGGNAPTTYPTRSPFPAADGVHVHPRGLPVTDQDWEIQPEGMTRLLTRLQEEYTGPRGVALYITENGCAFDDVVEPDGSVDDQNRLEFFDAHLRAVKDAIDLGADVRGYFAWSLLDNFEWTWGYGKRFGIVRVDYETQERTVKASGRWYAEVARDNTVPARD